MGIRLAFQICLWIVSANVIPAHILLTFPPARNSYLDFLDSMRTPPPCGVPKGSSKTTLLSGSTFNVTWNLNYPHRGGYKLEILDAHDKVLFDLTPVTPDDEFTAGLPNQSYQVHLPQNFTCVDCTLRLVHRSLDWGENYRLWSCSDVDILQRPQYRETCSGHGRDIVGRCRCNHPYYGPRCQYRDECDEDKDCGRHGRCLLVNAASFPKRQCFCQTGWFGPTCNKQSSVKKFPAINTSDYRKRELSPQFTLYWRVLRSSQELEAILVVQGSNYAALGWRPTSLGATCKAFPALEPTATLQERQNRSSVTVITEMETDRKFPVLDKNGPPVAEPLRDYTSQEGSTVSSSEDGPAKDDRFKRKALYDGDFDENDRERPVVVKLTDPDEPPVDHSKESSSLEIAAFPGPRVSSTTKSSIGSSYSSATLDPVGGSSNGWIPLISSDSFRVTDSKLMLHQPEIVSETPEPISINDGQHLLQNPLPDSRTSPEPVTENNHTNRNLLEVHPLQLTTTEKPVDLQKDRIELILEQIRNMEKEWDSREEEAEAEDTDFEDNSLLVSGSSVKPKVERLVETGTSGGILPKYMPRGDVHPMDCADIVVGMARGNLSRIGDFYTRDRSTPRRDNFYGGREDLTAALGFEKDGVTHILFRRKLNASEETDHAIIDDSMHVIWARGQEPSGASGFYQPDELKYHGAGDQRGVTSINFLEKDIQIDNSPSESSAASRRNSFDVEKKPSCGGDWRYPSKCDPEGSDCLYHAKWEHLRTEDIRFTLRVNYTKKWIAIGFSSTTGMPGTDIILGWVDPNGRVQVNDMWAVGYTTPLFDESQDIRNITGGILDGKTTVSFIRKRITADRKQDAQFTNDTCLYFKFPVYGGSYSPGSKRISKHIESPVVTAEPICFKTCQFAEETDSSKGNSQSALPDEVTSKTVYDLELKLAGLARNFGIPDPSSPEFNDLSDRLSRSVSSVLDGVPGFEKAALVRFTGGEAELIAHIRILLDEEDSRADVRMKQVLQDAVTSGIVGRVPVDPNYLVIQQPSSAPVEKDPKEKTVIDWSSIKLRPTVLWSIVGCLVGLVVLAVLQASYMVHKATHKKRTHHISKERVTVDFQRRNISAVNYGYEPFQAGETRGAEQQQPRSSRTQQSKPDFYFMPSQRRYLEEAN